MILLDIENIVVEINEILQFITYRTYSLKNVATACMATLLTNWSTKEK